MTINNKEINGYEIFTVLQFKQLAKQLAQIMIKNRFILVNYIYVNELMDFLIYFLLVRKKTCKISQV